MSSVGSATHVLFCDCAEVDMHVYGIISVVNRGDPPPSVFSTSSELVAKSLIGLRNEDGQFFIYIFPGGSFFQIKNNVPWLGVKPGCTFGRICFHQPQVDVLVCCESAQLKPFMRAVDLVRRELGPFYEEPSTSTGHAFPPRKIRKVYQTTAERSEEFIYTITISKEVMVTVSVDTGTLPDTVLTFVHLTVLNLPGCGMVNVPEGVGALPCLKTLNLPDNLLGRATRGSWNWLTSPIISSNLQELNLSTNKMMFVPEAIMHLTRLQRLDLTFNYLEDLPMSICNLTKLEYLSLDANKLKGLPGAIRQLPRLQSIHIRCNNFGNGVQECRIAGPVRATIGFQFKTLLEIAAEAVMRQPNRCQYWQANIPVHLANYLKYKVKYCRCGQPIFSEHAVTVCEMVMAKSLAQAVATCNNTLALVPVEHYICSNSCVRPARTLS